MSSAFGKAAANAAESASAAVKKASVYTSEVAKKWGKAGLDGAGRLSKSALNKGKNILSKDGFIRRNPMTSLAGAATLGLGGYMLHSAMQPTPSSQSGQSSMPPLGGDPYSDPNAMTDPYGLLKDPYADPLAQLPPPQITYA